MHIIFEDITAPIKKNRRFANTVVVFPSTQESWKQMLQNIKTTSWNMRNYRKKVSWKEILKRTHQNKHSNMDIPCANCGKTFKNKETFLSFPFFSTAQKELSSCNWWTVDWVIRKWLLFFFCCARQHFCFTTLHTSLYFF